MKYMWDLSEWDAPFDDRLQCGVAKLEYNFDLRHLNIFGIGPVDMEGAISLAESIHKDAESIATYDIRDDAPNFRDTSYRKWADGWKVTPKPSNAASDRLRSINAAFAMQDGFERAKEWLETDEGKRTFAAAAGGGA